ICLICLPKRVRFARAWALCPLSTWTGARSRCSRTNAVPLFARWRAERDLERRATTFVQTLFVEPGSADVEWLARVATRGDLDHARWELRYARRALGLIAAQRDARDDRTA